MDSLSKETLFPSSGTIWLVVAFFHSHPFSSKTSSTMLSITLYYKKVIFAALLTKMKKMKKLIYTLLAVSIIFAACKKEDEVTTPVTPSAISGCMDAIATNYDATATSDDGSCTFGIVGGAWITDSEELDMHVIVSMGGMVVMDTSLTEIENNQDSMESVISKFSNNGDFNAWDNNNNHVDSGTWVQSGSTVAITTDTVIVGEIISVTKTDLVHQVIGNETFTEDGVDYDIDFVFTGYHTRDENGFTSNNTNQRKGNTSLINKRKLINSIKR